ncbi:MAG: hypothetical protein KGH69_04180 [Candidatus Micrarchaeota archaeon]|nr:hypothetical protein [Candidatus Micrarchaeota archaeon]
MQGNTEISAIASKRGKEASSRIGSLRSVFRSAKKRWKSTDMYNRIMGRGDSLRERSDPYGTNYIHAAGIYLQAARIAKDEKLGKGRVLDALDNAKGALRTFDHLLKDELRHYRDR